MLSIISKVGRALKGRLRPESIYVGDYTLLARTLYGHWIYLDSRDTSITPSITLAGDWEPFVSKVFHAALRPGMSVVDIGCNCGFYTLIAAGAVGEAGRVVAIDANPRMVELTRRSVAANTMMDRVRVLHGAVVDAARTVEIGVPDEFMGAGSMLIRNGEHDGRVTTIKAPGDRLEAFLNGDRRVDILKIDAEGAEPLILTGAESILRDNRDIKIFMEFAPPVLQNLEPPGELLARIRSYGFNVLEISRDAKAVPREDSELLTRSWTELLLKR